MDDVVISNKNILGFVSPSMQDITANIQNITTENKDVNRLLHRKVGKLLHRKYCRKRNQQTSGNTLENLIRNLNFSTAGAVNAAILDQDLVKNRPTTVPTSTIEEQLKQQMDSRWKTLH